jgi:hypothetical protein
MPGNKLQLMALLNEINLSSYWPMNEILRKEIFQTSYDRLRDREQHASDDLKHVRRIDNARKKVTSSLPQNAETKEKKNSTRKEKVASINRRRSFAETSE